ncbi:MAG: hypothetical protein H0X30_39725 [Anaerolineae bacterium]|nr:hypothetical protein [Anaerolineae bacterium]
MTHYYVVLETDDDDNLVVKSTQRTEELEVFARKGLFPAWNIVGEGYIVTLYGGALDNIPTGDNREKIEILVLHELGLRQRNTRLELHLVVTQSPDVEEFRDSVGINLVIPATDIAICGIFVWEKHQADLKIYETSLLRTNARLYIEVFKIAVELADRLAERGVQMPHEIKAVLHEAARQFSPVKLTVK